MTTRTLVLIRHAKSDWDVPVPDRQRPLNARGARQAPATGKWLSNNGIQPDLALVSPAVRAQRTWEIVAAELPTQPRVEVSETAYTFDGRDLLRLVRGAPEVTTLAIVGHNPAMEELIESLTGRSARMPTSALAVLDGSSWDAPLGSWTIRYAGRPADE